MKAFLSDGRYYFRTHEVYKGVKFVCCGTSRKGKKQAKENWEKNNGTVEGFDKSSYASATFWKLYS